MKNIWLASVIVIATALASMAGITRISEGGVEVVLDDILKDGEVTVLVFHADWSQESVTLLDELTTWSDSHSNISLVFIDAVDARSQVMGQFSIETLPSMIIYNGERAMIGGIVNDVDSMETVLSDEGLL